MKRPLLILRPQPGAGETAARARRLGLEPLVAPLFVIRPVAWDPPDARAFDAILLTSANAARQAGSSLARFVDLPCWAVGEATAAAAREAGFAEVATEHGDAANLAAAAAEAGVRHALHLHGADHVTPCWPGLGVEGRVVYAAEAVSALPEEARAAGEPVALIHSARAGALFAALAADKAATALAAISPAAAAAAGDGWAEVAVASIPTDEALLELAVKLCKRSQPGRTGTGGTNGL